MLMAFDEDGKEYEDNGERAVFYARGIIETVKKMRWNPDVVICQGWASVVAPILIKKAFHEELAFRDSKVVFVPSAPDILKLKTTPQFRKDIVFKSLTADELSAYPEQLDITDLYHLAIDYSDGVFFTPESMDEQLMEYAKAKKLPVAGPLDLEADGLDRMFELLENLG